MEKDCASCRLLLSGHPCGHWWLDGVRQERIRWWQWTRRRERRRYARALLYDDAVRV